MRIKTRVGFCVSIPDQSVVSQTRHSTGFEVYYTLLLKDGRHILASEPINTLSIIDEVRSSKLESVFMYSSSSSSSIRELPTAESCPSVGGAMTSSKALDEFAHEKVKGETFFTHKTSPGLVIKSPKGDIIHETKMKDMYKRRDS